MFQNKIYPIQKLKCSLENNKKKFLYANDHLYVEYFWWFRNNETVRLY